MTLAENRYGKSRVRLVQVKRHAGHRDFREWTVEILLQGDFDSCFVEGDNSKILPTDTIKNTVYSLARSSHAECMEDFGKEVAVYLLNGNPQVSSARVSLSEKCWEPLPVHGKPHPTAFVQSSGELQTAEIVQPQEAAPQIYAGLENLVVMKTADSAFAGFLKDSLTTLPETTDRLFGTALGAKWKYSAPSLPFAKLRATIRGTLLEVFANHKSASVQHTLYAMGEAALAQVPELEDIELTMPNKHCLLVDLSRFGQDNPSQIFVPTDEPHGYIQARLRR
jgi:urate oxidase